MTPIEQMLTTQAALQKTGPQLSKLSKACTGLEASFLQTMVSQMRQGTSAVHFGEQECNRSVVSGAHRTGR